MRGTHGDACIVEEGTATRRSASAVPSTVDRRGKEGIVLGRIPWHASARAGDAGIHCHASDMPMVGPPLPETESVVVDGSCRLSVCSSGAAGSMEPWRLCRGGSESVPR